MRRSNQNKFLENAIEMLLEIFGKSGRKHETKKNLVKAFLQGQFPFSPTDSSEENCQLLLH